MWTILTQGIYAACSIATAGSEQIEGRSVVIEYVTRFNSPMAIITVPPAAPSTEKDFPLSYCINNIRVL